MANKWHRVWLFHQRVIEFEIAQYYLADPLILIFNMDFQVMFVTGHQLHMMVRPLTRREFLKGKNLMNSSVCHRWVMFSSRQHAI